MRKPTRQQVRFLNTNVMGAWTYNEETKCIDVMGKLVLYGIKLNELPVELGEVDKMECVNTGIRTLKGFPLKSNRITIVEYNIQSIDWYPTEIETIEAKFGESLFQVKLLLEFLKYLLDGVIIWDNMYFYQYHEIEKHYERLLEQEMIKLL